MLDHWNSMKVRLTFEEEVVAPFSQRECSKATIPLKKVQIVPVVLTSINKEKK
jgi:hypothetical protein